MDKLSKALDFECVSDIYNPLYYVDKVTKMILYMIDLLKGHNHLDSTNV
jgi:hypothetical protein